MEQRVVTILGGTGFLGHYVVQQLAKAGYRIRVISRNPDSGQDLLTYGDVGQIALLPGNITEPASYAGALKGSCAVINLVGILYEKGKQRFSEIHSLGAEKLAVAAKEAGVARFIHISALGVENECGSSYARSKILGERAVMSAFPEATVIRPGIMFGAEDNFFNKFAKMAQISLFLPLIGGGKTLFQPVYVADVAAAIVVCLEKNETKGQTYELGGPNIYSFRQIMEYILAVTGKRRLLVPIPFSLAYLLGGFAEFYPKPILTRDQVKILKHDNNANPTAKSFALLGIKPTAAEMVAPEYLSIYHKKAAA